MRRPVSVLLIMQPTLLIVDDESDVIDLLRYNLHRAGYKISTAVNGLEALKKARAERPDLIVLDIMLPEMDGYAVCKALKEDRETAAIPVLMLTAKGTQDQRISGLRLGADDYMAKPFSPQELILRIQAILKRLRAASQPEVLEIDGFEVHKNTFEITLEGEKLDLTSTEFKLLSLLIERRGRTQSRETLLYDVWRYQNLIDTRTVDTHIRRLREKMGDHADRLETIRGEGYRFVPKPQA